MPQGLEVFDSNGVSTVDTSTNVALFLGIFSVGGEGSAKSGQITNPLLANGRPFHFLIVGRIPSAQLNQEVEISFSGTTLNWSYPQDEATFANRPPTTIMYGTY